MWGVSERYCLLLKEERCFDSLVVGHKQRPIIPRRELGLAERFVIIVPTMPVTSAQLDLGSIEITWRGEDSKGYTDVLPIARFSQPCKEKTLIHEVRGPRGGSSEAKCHLIVRERTVDLDYTVFPEFNRRRDMYIGTMRLFFSDSDRTAVEQVVWKDDNTFGYSPTHLETTVIGPKSIVPYEGPGQSDATKGQRLVRERPGQVLFRKKLKSAYKHECCISACRIPEVLDGAHIDAYSGPQSDHVQNGLLLRRDLHRLFDAGLLAVNHDSLVVCLAPEIKDYEDYRRFAQTKISIPENKDHAPCLEALKRRWLQFVQCHGSFDSTARQQCSPQDDSQIRPRKS